MSLTIGPGVTINPGMTLIGTVGVLPPPPPPPPPHGSGLFNSTPTDTSGRAHTITNNAVTVVEDGTY